METQHQAGDVIGDRYRIVAPLGQGGMGTTYEAEDLTNYQRVAIKPQNIIRCLDGRVFLVDFGSVQEVYRNTLTRGGTFVGTLGYVPQEQFCGNVQPASDLYSLGATLLFLLTKRSPDELPLRRMKIDFRRYVKVSSEFADWLEKILEPAIEDRFESAKVALEALQGNKDVTSSVPLPTKSKHEPPKRFRVKRSDRHLVVEIFPTGVSALIGAFFFLAISVLPWVSFQRAGNLDSIGITLICSVIGLSSLFGSLWNLAGCIRLEIDKQNFRLQWMIRGLTFRQIQGQTADIERIERVDIKRKETTESRVIFWDGIRQHHLSIGSRQEDQWLADEASDFLVQLRYGKRSQ